MERGSGRKRLAVRETLIRKARQALKAGIAVNLGTLPVHLMTYYQFPLYSILLNLAVIPLMTVVMGAGLLCMLTGTVFPGVARGIGAIDRGILWSGRGAGKREAGKLADSCLPAADGHAGSIWASGEKEAFGLLEISMDIGGTMYTFS